MRIDSHQHFWNYDTEKHNWIDDSMAILKHDFLPRHLQPLLQQLLIDGCVTVQCETSTDEIHRMLQHAKQNDFIKGIVGWLDFTAANVKEQLEYFSQFNLLKGFRHVVQAEPDERFLLRKDFCNGIAQLAHFNFTYDILIFPHQLPAAVEFAKLFPNQKFVLDHIAKPNIAKQEIDGWRRNIYALAACKNIWCKLSGMVTEADWHTWKQQDYTPYMQVIFEAFGTSRVMFGSDWPVCKLAASYEQVYNIANEYVSQFSATEQQDFWGNNATTFYNLK